MRSEIILLLLSTCVLSAVSKSEHGENEGKSELSKERKRRNVGIKCIGYGDIHTNNKGDEDGSTKSPFKDECSSYSYCVTAYFNGEQHGRHIKLRLSGCPPDFNVERACSEGERGLVKINTDQGSVDAHIECCETDYCNKNASDAAATVRVADPFSLTTEEDSSNTYSTLEFDSNDLVNQILRENEKLTEENGKLEHYLSRVVDQCQKEIEELKQRTTATPEMPPETTTENSSKIAFITLSTLLSAVL